MLQQTIEKGIIKPEHIAPDVSNFSFYVDAFNELGTCRNSGFGVSPIPFTAIVEYSTLNEVEDFPSFLEVIRIMDREYIRQENIKSEAKKPKKKSEAPPASKSITKRK